MSRATNGPVLLLLLGGCLIPACAAEPGAEPERPDPPAEAVVEEDDSDLWSEVQALYEKAKAAGEQVPGTTMEWIREDLDRIGDWEYRVISLAGTPEQTEEQLNELGHERWECFWVQGEGAATRFFLKRPARSYLSSVPVTSLIRLLPVGGGGGAE